LVSWVVTGLSVGGTTSSADGWVLVKDGARLCAAKLGGRVVLFGTAASGNNVGVVVVLGEVLVDIDDLTAWAGLFVGIEEAVMVVGTAAIATDGEAALVVHVGVGLVGEDLAVEAKWV